MQNRATFFTFKKVILFSVLTFSMVAILGTAVLMLYHLERFNTLSQKMNQAEKLSTQIIYFDEVLTKSAKMYAYDGSPSWKSRYNQYAEKLEDTLKKAKEIDAQLKAFLLKTSALNEQLIAIELMSIQKVTEGHPDEAVALLSSEPYLTYKQNYAFQMDKAFEFIHQSNDTLLAEHQKWLQFFVMAVIFQAIVYLIIWLYLLSFLRSNHQRLNTLITTDELTGLYNRREFNNALNNGLAQSLTDKKWFLFAMIDIDHFKKYNDLYGHPKGDDALIALSKLLKENALNTSMSFFRLGGEEFGVLALIDSKEEAFNWFNQLFEKLALLNIHHQENPPHDHITMSVGVSFQSPHVLKTEDQIYSEADQALYQAKEKGRNQLVEYGEKGLYSSSSDFL
ncbi:MAG: GGDEF domain-containing protein [Thiomicrorhabdus sp.]|nr:GGDEF domain-containing protein [Thiomicrorhabdus sp.]